MIVLIICVDPSYWSRTAHEDLYSCVNFLGEEFYNMDTEQYTDPDFEEIDSLLKDKGISFISEKNLEYLIEIHDFLDYDLEKLLNILKRLTI